MQLSFGGQTSEPTLKEKRNVVQTALFHSAAQKPSRRIQMDCTRNPHLYMFTKHLTSCPFILVPADGCSRRPAAKINHCSVITFLRESGMRKPIKMEQRNAFQSNVDRNSIFRLDGTPNLHNGTALVTRTMHSLTT